MVTADDHYRLVGIAWRLDRLRWVPVGVLDEIVARDGLCLQPGSDVPIRVVGHGVLPAARKTADAADRELAARLCAQCPVQDECLELELRTAGEETTGVWGALNERDRQAVYPYWRQRGERAEPLEHHDFPPGGGEND